MKIVKYGLVIGFLMACGPVSAQQLVKPCFVNANGGCTSTSSTNGLPVNVVAGGAGGGAVYGPTAVGSAAANPPILAGGTADATATGTVQVRKVNSSGEASSTIADGSDVTLGAKADSACATATGSCSVAALLKFLNSTVNADPCGGAKSFAPFSLTASGQIITGTSGKKIYICSINLVSATAQNIALVEGTGTNCATNCYGLAGGTTAATGWNFAANGGLTEGSGVATIINGSGDANAAGANAYLLLSSTGQTSGTIGYVLQ